MLAPGTLFAGRFRVEARIAGGGMGEVFRAELVSTGRRVALKVLRPEALAIPGLREGFAREARVGATIPSRHVVEVLDAGVDDARSAPWLAMELLEGRSLHAALLDGAPRDPGEVAHVFAQLGDALGAAHDAGVIHLDLKPENLFLADVRIHGLDGPVLKVLDFGIARVLGADQTSAGVTTAAGAPLWMAPEQTQVGGRVRPSTDVWSLGLIAYRMLTGRCFWRAGNTRPHNIRAVLAELAFLPLPSASERAADQGVGRLLPPDFDPWFAHCVHRDPSERFQNGRAAAAALRGVLAPPSAWDDRTVPDEG